MKILDKYILKNTVISFIFTLTIFTFVLFTGTLFKIAQMFIGKINLIFILKFFAFSIPYLLSYAIPMSFLTAVLLVFGQLSAENEITALKACGVNIFRIIMAPLILSIFLTGLCIFLNDIVLPYCHYELRKLKYDISTQSPAALIEAGVSIDYFDGYQLYIDEIEDGELRNISIQQNIPDEPTRFIKAERGRFEVPKGTSILRLTLNDVILEQEQKQKENDGAPSFLHAQMGYVPIELKLDEEYNKDPRRRYRKRIKDFSIRELLDKIGEIKTSIAAIGPFEQTQAYKNISKYKTEISTRLSLAFSCIGLLFIGSALGIRTHRSEKTVGIPISLAIFAVHYGFTLFAKALEKQPACHPEIIVWIPDLCLGIVGIYLLYKIAYR